MSLSVLFITQEDFEGYVDLSQNIDSKYVTPHIRLAQETTIKDILCKDMYNTLLEEYDNDTLSYENADLLEYVKKCLVFYAYKRYLLYSQIRSTPHGMVHKNSEESSQITDKRLGELINDADSMAKFYEGELREFLEDNENDYPDWRDSDCGCDKTPDGSFWISKV